MLPYSQQTKEANDRTRPLADVGRVVAWSLTMPYPSSQSRPNPRNQPLLFGDDLAETVLPGPSDDGEVAGRILEDRERRLRSNGTAEAGFELSSGTSGPAKRPAREVPDQCVTTLPRRRDE